MKAPKIILIGAFSLFAIIGVLSLFKEKEEGEKIVSHQNEKVEEIHLEQPVKIQETAEVIEVVQEEVAEAPQVVEESLPEVDLINRFFATNSSKFPIVETVSYTSRVPWLKGRPAWIADYASHYSTSRHFIARSLNRKADYFTQKISPGDRFNVFNAEKDIEFRLVIDLSRCKMWFYYWDKDTNERVLVKTYSVGLGRKDESKVSGYLTPAGKYKLGDKIAIYKPGTMGYFQEQKTEMIRVFGTRWIPFDQEVEGCTESFRGYGIHGLPWSVDDEENLIENTAHIEKYDSDGCIRLHAKDIEELFSIIITKPCVVELVKDFHDAELPGIEREKGAL